MSSNHIHTVIKFTHKGKKVKLNYSQLSMQVGKIRSIVYINNRFNYLMFIK